jgi:polyphosphate kinase
MSAELVSAATASQPRDVSARLIDRDESWLAWNQRLLELAETKELPLLERLRFLAIFATNLDEFFMVRVARLKRRLVPGVDTIGLNSQGPRPQLERISKIAHQLSLRHSLAFRRDIRFALAAEGVHILCWVDLSAAEKSRMHAFFRTRLYPVLTPLAVDATHPFPYISGLSLNLAVVVRDPTTGRPVFARVKVPPSLPRFVEASKHRFVPLEDVIAAAGPDRCNHRLPRRQRQFRQSLGRFAVAYAEQTVGDHKALVEAIDTKRVPTHFETD